jgi:hypothetical protein
VVLHCGPGRGFGHGNRLTKSATTVVATSNQLDTTINPEDYTYSNLNKTIKNKSGTTNQSALSVSSVSTGKIYWEVTVDTTAGSSAAGIAGTGLNTATFPGGQAQGAEAINGVFWTNNVNTTAPTFTTGARLAFAFDCSTKTLWIGTVSAGVITWFGGGNPATATGGKSCSTLTAPFRALVVAAALNDQMTICLSAADQTATPPSGFSTWA